MNRTQDTIILEKIFNERLELSIYKNRGQFYLTKNLSVYDLLNCPNPDLLDCPPID